MKMSTNPKMDVENIFHMTGGSGSTSYANNCSFQMKASDMVKHIIVETIEQLYLETFPKTIAMADMGCCSGRNSLPVIKTIVESVEEKSRLVAAEVEPPEFYVYLNDLPSNDFNSIFKALPGFFRQLMEERNGGVCPSVFIAGCAGSFYGRLLPKNSMQFIYSSYCLHWLSKVPPGLFNEKGESINKGNLYISESSPPSVSLAYLSQFQDDFSLFLRSRSNELVCRARMLLILLGRLDQDNHVDRGNSFYWELLTRSLAILASQGKIKKEKLDGYHAHFYAASKWEIEDIVRREGSFFLDRFEMYQPDQKTCHGVSYGSAVAMTVRAAQEVMLRHHFGLEDDDGVIDSLFDIYGNMVDEEMSKEEIKAFTFLLVLKKL